MIRVFSASEMPKVIRKCDLADEDVFLRVRDFFRCNPDIRHHKVVVYKEDIPVYCLGYMKNEPVEVYEHRTKDQISLSEFWDYSPDDEGLDYSYTDRYQTIIFSELEEYSFHAARMIRRHSPDTVIVFKDPEAAHFFQEDDTLLIAASEAKLYEKRPDLKERKTLRVYSEIRWDALGVFIHQVSSYMVMTSLYWTKPTFCYGPDNPDKTFYLIRIPLNEIGLSALITHVIRTKQMIRSLCPDLIPVIDLGTANDRNQFAGVSGEDVWSMFFRPLSDHTLQEVYNSRNVILDQSINMKMNPRMTEYFCSKNWTEVKYGNDLLYKEEVSRHTMKVLKKTFPSDAARNLAVIVRGTDYTTPKVSRLFPNRLTAEQMLTKSVRYMKEHGFDYVYLCTEDQGCLDVFRNSELRDRLIYIDQERIDYQKEENQSQMLMEIYEREHSDPYTRSLNYIAVLEGLTRCSALLANLPCGAVTYALGRDTDYEFVDVPDLKR